MTTDSTTPTGPHPRSLPFTMVVGAVAFAIFVPLIEYLPRLSGEQPPPLPLWIQFSCVMAVIGVCAGAALHQIQVRRPAHKRLHLCALGVTIALASGADIEDFTNAAFGWWILRYLVGSLILGTFVGVITYAVWSRKDSVPPAQPPR